jgi:predicted site-specific integrase-resolvase
MDNDPHGVLRALDEIEKLKKELRDQRADFETQIKLLKECQENIVEVLKDTASKADLEQVRDGVIATSEMVRTNIADVITAAAARISKTH